MDTQNQAPQAKKIEALAFAARRVAKTIDRWKGSPPATEVFDVDHVLAVMRSVLADLHGGVNNGE